MKSSSNSVRWREGQKENLERVAKRLGLEPIDLIRAAVDALVDYVDAHGGRILLPLKFDQTFKVFSVSGPKGSALVLHEPPRRIHAKSR